MVRLSTDVTILSYEIYYDCLKSNQIELPSYTICSIMHIEHRFIKWFGMWCNLRSVERICICVIVFNLMHIVMYNGLEHRI